MLIQPRDGLIGHVAARPFVRGTAWLSRRHAVTVGGEPALQAESTIERKRTHERARRKPRAPECFGKRGHVGAHANAVVPRARGPADTVQS